MARPVALMLLGAGCDHNVSVKLGKENTALLSFTSWCGCLHFISWLGTSSYAKSLFIAGNGQPIKTKIGDGSMVTLEDNSVWQIDIMGRLTTVLGFPVTEITVVELSDGYLLVNTDDGEKARAVFLSQ
jgi:hypothetical protein